VMTAIVVIYLGRTAVVIDIKDPGVEVAVKGTTLTVTGPDKQSVKVVPGDQELTITCAGLETTTKSFTIKKGETKAVTVSIVNSKLVARLENEIAPLTTGHEEKTSSPTASAKRTSPQPTPGRKVATSTPTASGKKPLPSMTPSPEAMTTPTLPPTFKNSLGMEFVLVPKGKSWLGGGRGKPGDKEVVIAHDFYLGKYEVTQEEWNKVMVLNPSYFSRTGGGKNLVRDIADAELNRFPVENVSWDDAQKFLERLNTGEQKAGWVYRLPMAAEWEYACRGGPLSDKSESAYDFYFDKPTNQLLPEQANVSRYLQRTCKVGSYPPNRLGLYDMHGNVWEWCNDPERTVNGASSREPRGGGWSTAPVACKAAYSLGPARWEGRVGLRLARSSGE